ncbi:S8 family serine peptidase [Dehalococcoides mccartyi]|nr:S8 family serine peptidase [Dehalococcoides mccartyi]
MLRNEWKRWISIGLGLLLVAFAATSGPTEQASAASGSPGAVPSHVVVLQGHVDFEDFAAAQGLSIAAGFSSAFNGFAANLPPGIVKLLENHPDVLSVEENKIFTIDPSGVEIAGDGVATSSTQQIPNGISRIGATESTIANIDGVDERVPVMVAVLDTGVDGSHPDLNVNIVLSADCSNGIYCVTGVATDPNGHGTHVSGTIAALDNSIGVVGVAPGAEIVSVRVCDNGGSCSLSAILLGHEYVSSISDQVSVVNMSLGGAGWSTAWHNAVKSNVDNGVVVVVAAGNSWKDLYGNDSNIGTGNEQIPAAFPEAMAVSAMVDLDGVSGGLGGTHGFGYDDGNAGFSNYGEAVVTGNPVTSSGASIDIAAPGVGILSSFPGGQYAYMNGTSMASPHVAGAAALIAATGRATDAESVYAIRQQLIDAGAPMAGWRPDSIDTNSDLDSNHEPLVSAAISGEVIPLPEPEPTPTPTPEPTPAPEPIGPEPAVVSIDVPASALSGDSANVTAVVTNNGDESSTFTVGFRDDTDSFEIGSLVVTLEPGASSSHQVVWNTVGLSIGSHAISVNLSVASDADMTNNSANGQSVVSVPLAPAELTVWTTGTNYSNRDMVYVYVRLEQSDGTPVIGTSVLVSITGPKGNPKTVNVTTNSSGRATVKMKLNTKRTGCGDYGVSVNATDPQGNSLSSESGFSVC